MLAKLDCSVRIIALFEAAKGSLVFVVGLGILTYIHNDLQKFGQQIIYYLHLNPANYWQNIVLSGIVSLEKVRPVFLAVGSIGYAAVRLIEAYGLWHGKRWAEWFAALSIGLYIPIELYRLLNHASALRIIILVVNIFVVALMVYALKRSKGMSRRENI